MAFTDAFDMTFAMNNDIRRINSHDIPIAMLTEIFSLFDFITKANIFSYRRLMIDEKVVKDAHHRNEVGSIVFIRSEYNSDDSSTKLQKSDIIRKMLHESILSQLKNG